MPIIKDDIQEMIRNGVGWLRMQQNEDGSYGKWGMGSTCFALMALMESGIPVSDPAVKSALTYIRDSSPKSTCFCSLSILALVHTGKKTAEMIKKLQADIDWLIEAQMRNPRDKASYGGWAEDEMNASDGLSTQYAVMALRSAYTWGIEVRQEVWRRAVMWYQQNYDIARDGSFRFRLDGSHVNEQSMACGMTAAALSSLKAIFMLAEEPDIKQQVHFLFTSALEWLDAHYHVALASATPGSWYFYYLYSLAVGCTIEPLYAVLEKHNWAADVTDALRHIQQSDGRWVCERNKESTDIVYTSLALLTLNKAVLFKPDEKWDGAAAAIIDSNIVDDIYISKNKKLERKIQRCIRSAKFPLIKTLENFDFRHLPGLDPSLIWRLAGCDFVNRKENIVLIGNPGTGKTHLAIAIGRKACEHGFRVKFYTAAELINLLANARSRRRISRLTAQLHKVDLLIIDELSYLTLSRPMAEQFFQIISARDERGSMIITSNYAFSQWHKIFGDAMLTAATIDRLTHRTYIFDTHGPSYRVRQQIKINFLSS